MKRKQISRIATAIAIASFAGLVSACGSSGSGATVASIAGTGVGGTASNSGGCVQLTTTMSFSATDAYMDSANIYAVPMNTGGMETYVSAGGSVATTTGNGIYSNTWNSAVSDAYVSMNISNYNSVTPTSSYLGYSVPVPTYGSSYPYSAAGAATTTTLTGSLQFTALRWETLIYEFQSMTGYGYGYGTTTTTNSNIIPNVCVSGVALSVGHYNNLLYGGQIYLFLNNTTSSYIDIVL